MLNKNSSGFKFISFVVSLHLILFSSFSYGQTCPPSNMLCNLPPATQAYLRSLNSTSQQAVSAPGLPTSIMNGVTTQGLQQAISQSVQAGVDPFGMNNMFGAQTAETKNDSYAKAHPDPKDIQNYCSDSANNGYSITNMLATTMGNQNKLSIPSNAWVAYLFPTVPNIQSMVKNAPANLLQAQAVYTCEIGMYEYLTGGGQANCKNLYVINGVATYENCTNPPLVSPTTSDIAVALKSAQAQQQTFATLQIVQTFLNNTAMYGAQLIQDLNNSDYAGAISWASAHGLLQYLEFSVGFQALGVNHFTPEQMSEFYQAAAQAKDKGTLQSGPIGFGWGSDPALKADPSNTGCGTDYDYVSAMQYGCRNWTDSSTWPQAAQNNLSKAGDNVFPDLVAFASQPPPKPSTSTMEIVGQVFAAVVIGVISAGAATAVVGAAMGAAGTAAGGAAAGTTVGAAGGGAAVGTTAAAGVGSTIESAALTVGTEGMVNAVAAEGMNGGSFGQNLLSSLEGAAIGQTLAPVTGGIATDLGKAGVNQTVANYTASLAVGTASGAALNGGNFNQAFVGAATGAGIGALTNGLENYSNSQQSSYSAADARNAYVNGDSMNGSSVSNNFQAANLQPLSISQLNQNVGAVDLSNIPMPVVNYPTNNTAAVSASSGSYAMPSQFDSYAAAIDLNQMNLDSSLNSLGNAGAGAMGAGLAISNSSFGNSVGQSFEGAVANDSNFQLSTNDIAGSAAGNGTLKMYSPSGEIPVNIVDGQYYYAVTDLNGNLVLGGPEFATSNATGMLGHHGLGDAMGVNDIGRSSGVIFNNGNVEVGGFSNQSVNNLAAYDTAVNLENMGFNVTSVTGGRMGTSLAKSNALGMQNEPVVPGGAQDFLSYLQETNPKIASYAMATTQPSQFDNPAFATGDTAIPAGFDAAPGTIGSLDLNLMPTPGTVATGTLAGIGLYGELYGLAHGDPSGVVVNTIGATVGAFGKYALGLSAGTASTIAGGVMLAFTPSVAGANENNDMFAMAQIQQAQGVDQAQAFQILQDVQSGLITQQQALTPGLNIMPTVTVTAPRPSTISVIGANIANAVSTAYNSIAGRFTSAFSSPAPAANAAVPAAISSTNRAPASMTQYQPAVSAMRPSTVGRIVSAPIARPTFVAPNLRRNNLYR